MRELTPALLAELWRASGAGTAPDEPFLAAVQKFMRLHEDLHEHWDRLAADPATPVVVGDRNLLVHVAMDASTETALAENQPAGITEAYAHLTAAGMDEGEAFHVISQAMETEYLVAASKGREMELEAFLARARDYVVAALRARRA